MEITEKEVTKLAKFAKLEFEGERLKTFTKVLDDAVKFVSAVNDGEVCGGLDILCGEEISCDDLRSDEVEISLPCEKIIPEELKEDGYFSVKRLVK